MAAMNAMTRMGLSIINWGILSSLVPGSVRNWVGTGVSLGGAARARSPKPDIQIWSTRVGGGEMAAARRMAARRMGEASRPVNVAALLLEHRPLCVEQQADRAAERAGVDA